ncbi:hypothetical protein BDA99DRAFT_505564 [Phascolomyces articulosus]|uniref:Uncharacterized protein n=1 Tax=Phascolomyces articulosus TaxID=60185 RepID=A0AAD5K467_9FUNG|nr:hypothetical protein BDA99DRAFT_505564 [Phascolomyces articulosus]
MDPCYPGLWPQQTNIDIDPAPPYDARSSLANISVAEVLERYQHDTDLMRHILAAKAEEDKRRAAEELRLVEEARLQSKYLDFLEGGNSSSNSQHNRRYSDHASLIDSFGESCFFISFNLEKRNYSTIFYYLIDSLGMSSTPNNNNNDAATVTSVLTPQSQWMSSTSSLPMMPASQFLDKTPPSPSPSFLPPNSPYASFDVPFAELSISASSSPEPSHHQFHHQHHHQHQHHLPPQQQQQQQQQQQSLPQQQRPKSSSSLSKLSQEETRATTPPPPPPPSSADTQQQPERSCKRTLSRTRSQRRTPSTSKNSKRNKRVSQQQLTEEEQQQQQQQQQQQHLQPPVPTQHTIILEQHPQQQQQSQPPPPQQQQKKSEEPRLDHGKVMQALRAKLQRSSNPQKSNSQYQQQQQEEADQQAAATAAASMSPTGILLLDLKNPRKSFPPRKPHVAAVRRPRPFASAHNYCESGGKSTSSSTTSNSKSQHKKSGSSTTTSS